MLTKIMPYLKIAGVVVVVLVAVAKLAPESLKSQVRI